MPSTRNFESSEECTAQLGDCRVFKIGLLGFEADDNRIPGVNVLLEEATQRNTCKNLARFNYINGDVHSWIEILQLRNVPVKQISVGGYHLLVLLENRKVLSIGWNLYGQCGYSTTTDCNRLQEIIFPTHAAPVKSCKACGRHSLFLMEDGTVYSCGNNEDGRCGVVSETSNITPPMLIKTLLGHRITAISSGFWHSFFITEEGNCFGCGDNRNGQLGINMNNYEDTTIQFPTLIHFNGKRVLQATGGANFSLFLVTGNQGNQVFGCGDNTWNQISHQEVDSLSQPMEISFFNNKQPIKVCCGSNFSLVLCKDGNVYSFGCSALGKTGHNTIIQIANPTKINQFANNVKDVFEGSNHILILTKDEKVYSFGWNRYNQCGPTKQDSIAPSLLREFENIQISQISCGAFCSLITTYKAKKHGILSFRETAFLLYDVEIYCNK